MLSRRRVTPTAIHTIIPSAPPLAAIPLPHGYHMGTQQRAGSLEREHMITEIVMT